MPSLLAGDGQLSQLAKLWSKHWRQLIFPWVLWYCRLVTGSTSTR